MLIDTVYKPTQTEVNKALITLVINNPERHFL